MIKHQAWATTIVAFKQYGNWVNDHERTDEANFQGEFIGVPGLRTAKAMSLNILSYPVF